MAERRGPTDGKRFSRVKPSGNHKAKQPDAPKQPNAQVHAKDGKPIDTRNGETLCTPEVQRKIINALKLGAYKQMASAAAGIANSTLISWMRRGARGEEPFRSFAVAVEKAQAEAKIQLLGRIQLHGNEHWQALAWILERTAPKEFGRKVEISGDDEAPIEIRTKTKVDLSKLSVAQLEQLEAMRAAARTEVQVDEDEDQE